MTEEDRLIIKTDDVIVCFLDILGFTSMIEQHIENPALIGNIEQIFRKAVGMVSKKIPVADKEFERYRDDILNAYQTRIISDSALFSMNISKIIPNRSFDANTNIANHLWLFFNAISMFYLMFTAKTGLIIRGGIAKGRHYENDENKNLFIFSEALVKAVCLEKKQKSKPLARVVVHEELINYLDKISFPHKNKCFDRDFDGCFCFNLYLFLKGQGEIHEKSLRDLKKALMASLRFNQENPKVVEKLKYFVEYHNRKMLEQGETLREFLIEN